MAINLTWHNIAALVALLGALLVALFSGTAAMMEWRIVAVEHQLSDRLSLYHREMDQVVRRLERLEQRP